MSNTYGSGPAPTPQPLGGSGLNDLVSTQKGGVQSLSQLVLAFTNAFRPATASSSPVVTGINTLGTTAASVVGSNTSRHGIVFHNPATTNVNVYIFPSTASPAPTLASTGGSLLILPGATQPFPSSQFPNVNCAFSAFAGTGTANALTIWEFL